ncbi:MAG: hypothetical protein ABIR37_00500 [Candidatus Saccharimonadales bacterium]
MAWRFKEQYGAVLEKRHQLNSAKEFSEPDEPGSKVAILVAFMAELVEHELDSQESFDRQTDKLVDYYTARQREPTPVVNATKGDFERVLADKSVSTVVVAGFGNFSAIAVPLQGSPEEPFRYGYLDWLHLAGMATHLKLGKFVALHCGGYMRQFNPPLAAGVTSSYRNILAPVGKGRFATGDWEKEVGPITTAEELSYDQIHETYPLRTSGKLAVLPAAAYVAVRGMQEQMRNPEFPKAERIPYPEEMKQYKA